MSASKIDEVLASNDYEQIVSLAMRNGILHRSPILGLQLKEPEFLSIESDGLFSLGKLYAYLLDCAEKRLGLRSGHSIEEIQGFCINRVREELNIVRKLFTWPDEFQAQFMNGIMTSSTASRNLLFTKAELQKAMFFAKKKKKEE